MTVVLQTKFQILTKYFMDNFPLELLLDQRKPLDWKEKNAKIYFEKILELDSVLSKIERYPVYFAEFYPSSGLINIAEAVEYHWHSYVSDVYMLKERMKNLIGSLKNDLPRYKLINPDDAVRLLDHLKTQVMKGLEGAVTFRKNHTHEKTARNFDLTRAKLLCQIKSNGVAAHLIDSNRIDDKIKEFTEKGRNDYIEMAQKNNLEMEKLRNFFAPRFGHLFATLNDHDYSIFTMD